MKKLNKAFKNKLCTGIMVHMYAFYMSVTLTNVNNLLHLGMHNYSSVLVHVSCCGNKEENGKCTCAFL